MMPKLPDIDRRLLIGIPIVAIVLLLIGFGVGRLTAGDAATSDLQTSADGSSTSSGPASEGSEDGTDDTPSSTISGDPAAALPPAVDVPEGGIPVYGTDADREALVLGLVESGVTGGTREGVLATADHVCFNLESLEAQNRSPAFAVGVVWNESLLELESEDLAAFGAVFAAAPYYLCPDSIEYGEKVAYWLGY